MLAPVGAGTRVSGLAATRQPGRGPACGSRFERGECGSEAGGAVWCGGSAATGLSSLLSQAAKLQACLPGLLFTGPSVGHLPGLATITLPVRDVALLPCGAIFLLVIKLRWHNVIGVLRSTNRLSCCAACLASRKRLGIRRLYGDFIVLAKPLGKRKSGARCGGKLGAKHWTPSSRPLLWTGAGRH